ncbi:hypothetical protein CBX96_07710 [Shewanella sp. BC20]|uniref:hypothetical protein n=1 Tax=Shewanella sp. BC20 TaxID=2004459 RepID=UPI000D64C1FF|nr:hypothetical protein [Shewanella sp. BC20]PWF64069.1 hypothetical protein CBX96_07710 [Shewanella sp. BC20]
MWSELGFRDNPYSPRPIQANEEGVELLVGRESELRRLMTYIRSSDTHPTLEGPNGVGKTSLVSVAGYKLFREFVDKNGPAFIPIEPPFQLTSEDNLKNFKQKVLFSVAQNFVTHNQILKEKGYEIPHVDDINRWLNSPLFHLNGGGASIAGFGGNVTHSTTPNSGTGFTESGFVATIQAWLKSCFPSNTSGGFICLIDNLELLETSKGARELLEAMRDELLNIVGLRWVLCGARGIIRSSASSPRLQGLLSDPIDVNPINDVNAELALQKRLEIFSIKEANAPVESDGFSHIYKIGNRNLRNSLKYCEDFAFWAYLSNSIPTNSKDKLDLIEVWMAEIADKYEKDTSGVGNRAWKVFDDLIAEGGSASPSDYENFGYDSQQSMRPQLKLLEDAHLIESAIDETDKRRRTIVVTSRGWIVHYKRSGFVTA